MASVRESVIDALEADLQRTGAPTGLTVHRQRLIPIERDDLPSIVLRILSETVERGAHGQTRMMRVGLECRAEATASDIDTAVDALLVWAEITLMQGPTLRPLVGDVELERISWDAVQADAALAGALLEATVSYQTALHDPEVTP